MANLLTWSIIITTNLILISLGFYSAYRFIEAYQNKKDLIKYQGYLINAFLLIIIPIIFTFGGLKFINSENPKLNQINIGIELKSSKGTNNLISFNSERYNFKPDKKKEIELEIFNNYYEDYKFSIDIYCLDKQNKCNEVINILEPTKNEFTIEPKVTFQLPISLNLRDDTPTGKYNFNITIRDKRNTIYDSIPLTISLN